MRTWIYWLVVPIVTIWGCGHSRLSLNQMYREIATDPLRTPLVFIHGTTGSRLVDISTRTIVWGEISARSIDGESPEGIRALALPVVDRIRSDDLANLADDVVVEDVMTRTHFSILGIPFSLDVYQNILEKLGIIEASDKDDPERIIYPYYPKNCFAFAYDWRKDNVTNAIRLGEFLEQKAKLIRQRDAGRGIDRGPVRFDIVTHSMGGLIARYYLRYGNTDVCRGDQVPQVSWAGARRISRLFLIAPPNCGSVNTMKVLLEGLEYSPFLPKFTPTVFATFPSVYQLLPRKGLCTILDDRDRTVPLEIYDAGTWRANQWGVFSAGQSRIVKLLLPSHPNRHDIWQRYMQAMLDRACRFHQALDARPDRSCPAQIYLFASQSFRTLDRLRARSDFQGWHIVFDEDLSVPGDGTVTIASALGDQLRASGTATKRTIPFSGIYLMDDRHFQMLNSRSLQNNLLHFLLHSPRSTP